METKEQIELNKLPAMVEFMKNCNLGDGSGNFIGDETLIMVYDRIDNTYLNNKENSDKITHIIIVELTGEYHFKYYGYHSLYNSEIKQLKDFFIYVLEEKKKNIKKNKDVFFIKLNYEIEDVIKSANSITWSDYKEFFLIHIPLFKKEFDPMLSGYPYAEERYIERLACKKSNIDEKDFISKLHNLR